LTREIANLNNQHEILETKTGEVIIQTRNFENESQLQVQSTSQLAVLKSEMNSVRAALTRKVAELRKEQSKQSKYELHLGQLKTARAKVFDVQNNLKPGECLVFRDFVNQHNELGKKVNNLVLVILYREVENGELLVYNISNICEFANGGSCDAYFVADVFDFHLRRDGSGLFKQFHTISISGDHGPHFSSGETVYNESTFFKKFEKKVQVFFLCSYHAFNRCDAAGAAVKTLAGQLEKEDHALLTSSDYTFAVRDSGQQNAWSYEFREINRSKSVFDGNGKTKSNQIKVASLSYSDISHVRTTIDLDSVSDSHSRQPLSHGQECTPPLSKIEPISQSISASPVTMTLQPTPQQAIADLSKFPDLKMKLAEMCELQYCFKSESGVVTYQEGIVLVRPISSRPMKREQEFAVVNLSKLAKDQGFCKVHSDINQRPMYHDKGSPCDIKRIEKADGLFSHMNLDAIPIPGRLCGLQMTKAQKRAQGRPNGIFPCRFDGCSFNFYNVASQSNSHMQGRHHQNETEANRQTALYNAIEIDQIKQANPMANKRKQQRGAKAATTSSDSDDESGSGENEGDDSDSASESDVVSERNKLINALETSENANPYKPKENELVWKISAYCPEGVKANEDNFDGQKVKIFRGVRQARINGSGGTPIGRDRIKYDEVAGVNPDEQVCDEQRHCLFKTNQLAKEHLYNLLKDKDSALREDIVESTFWDELGREFKEPPVTVVTKVPFEQNRDSKIQVNELKLVELGLSLAVNELKTCPQNKSSTKRLRENTGNAQVAVRRSTRNKHDSPQVQILDMIELM